MKKQNWKYLKDKDIFVMFRDPVNRVISAYFEKLRRSGGLQHSAETLKEYLSFHRTHNLQTGFLLGISPKGKIPDSRDLQSAKEMLRKLDIKIGILERYPESLQLLEAVTGKRIPNRTIKIENATDKGLLAEVDHATRESIKVKNSLDQELYAYAMELFEKQLKRIRSRGASEFEFQVPNP